MRATLDAVDLSLFAARLSAACDEMGAVLRRTAFSPNIRERLDFSCALFGPDGRLAAQAAHIPVHLGSMAYAMADIVDGFEWRPGDMLVFNDPFLGGTHLPDVTMLAPLFADDRLAGFVANRAHHADIGASAPGSMPLSTHLDEEGVLIAPTFLMRDGVETPGAWDRLLAPLSDPVRARGDFIAQSSANQAGLRRAGRLVGKMGLQAWMDGLADLDAYAGRLARAALQDLEAGEYTFTDLLDDDGAGELDVPVKVTLSIRPGSVHVDFAGTAPQVQGNLNCPLPVTAAAVWYVFRCLMPADMPACHGAFSTISIEAEVGSLVNAVRPAAVAAGNVETSQRIVDAVLGALAQAAPEQVCAAAQGTMNNIALGDRGWDYYETIGGGLGAHPGGDGLSGVQAHMTNTLNTPAEALELAYPLRVRCHALNRGSGGVGRYRGGEGIVHELELLAPATVTVISERRRRGPWGLAGGGDGACGRNSVNGVPKPGKFTARLSAGDRLVVRTPGGGGYGTSQGQV